MDLADWSTRSAPDQQTAQIGPDHPGTHFDMPDSPCVRAGGGPESTSNRPVAMCRPEGDALIGMFKGHIRHPRRVTEADRGRKDPAVTVWDGGWEDLGGEPKLRGGKKTCAWLPFTGGQRDPRIEGQRKSHVAATPKTPLARKRDRPVSGRLCLVVVACRTRCCPSGSCPVDPPKLATGESRHRMAGMPRAGTKRTARRTSEPGKPSPSSFSG